MSEKTPGEQYLPLWSGIRTNLYLIDIVDYYSDRTINLRSISIKNLVNRPIKKGVPDRFPNLATYQRCRLAI